MINTNIAYGLEGATYENIDLKNIDNIIIEGKKIGIEYKCEYCDSTHILDWYPNHNKVVNYIQLKLFYYYMNKWLVYNEKFKLYGICHSNKEVQSFVIYLNSDEFMDNNEGSDDD